MVSGCPEIRAFETEEAAEQPHSIAPRYVNDPPHPAWTRATPRGYRNPWIHPRIGPEMHPPGRYCPGALFHELGLYTCPGQLVDFFLLNHIDQSRRSTPETKSYAAECKVTKNRSFASRVSLPPPPPGHHHHHRYRHLLPAPYANARGCSPIFLRKMSGIEKNPAIFYFRHQLTSRCQVSFVVLEHNTTQHKNTDSTLLEVEQFTSNGPPEGYGMIPR